MDLAILRRIAAELDEMLRGGFISKIHQPLPRDVLIRVRPPGAGEKKLYLSADPRFGRAHVTGLRIPNPPTPPRFCAYLRAHVQGGRILSVDCLPHDRVLTITVQRGSEQGPVERSIILEILGRDSNILVVNRETGLIMDCLHHLPAKEAASRVVLPGAPYSPPPAREELRSSIPTDEEILGAQPGILSISPTRTKLALGGDPQNFRIFAAMNEAADAWYSPQIQGHLLEAFRREVAAPLRARMKSLVRRREKIEQDLRRLEAYAQARSDGELLKAHLRTLRRGMTSVVVDDWETGGKREIMLNPALGPVENMERFFKLSGKAKRGTQVVRHRLEETAEELRDMEDLLFLVDDASEIGDLEELARDGAARSRKPQAAATRKTVKESAPAAEPMVREYQAPGGSTVWVGKSGSGNAYLLRHKARDRDLWFHVHGTAGAHVVLAQRGGAAATEEDIRFAAGLAVRHSRAKGTGKTEVMVAERKDVTSPKGASPGQVIVKSYRTIMVEEP